MTDIKIKDLNHKELLQFVEKLMHALSLRFDISVDKSGNVSVNFRRYD